MENSLFNKYFLGEATEEEIKSIYKWIDDSSINKEKFLQYKKLWLMYIEANEDFTVAWQQVEKKIKAAENKKRRSTILKYAAILVIGVIAFASLFIKNEANRNPQNSIVLELGDGTRKIINPSDSLKITNQTGSILGRQQKYEITYKDSNASLGKKELIYNTLYVPYGKMFHLVLSDGSSIHLNSGTKIKYPVHFIKGKSREVFLDGEAYFNIAHNKQSAFIVRANNISTHVYGTMFNIKSYKNDSIREVVLVRGSVGVRKDDVDSITGQELMLMPNEKASINAIGSLSKRTVNATDYIAWINGVLIFNNERLENIFRILERHFNVTIQNNYTSINDNRYTATFDIETIDQILNSFSKNKPFTYKINKDKIIINP